MSSKISNAIDVVTPNQAAYIKDVLNHPNAPQSNSPQQLGIWPYHDPADTTDITLLGIDNRFGSVSPNNVRIPPNYFQRQDSSKTLTPLDITYIREINQKWFGPDAVITQGSNAFSKTYGGSVSSKLVTYPKALPNQKKISFGYLKEYH